MDLSDGTVADLIVLHLIGDGHPPDSEGDSVSLAMWPGGLVLAPVAHAHNQARRRQAGPQGVVARSVTISDLRHSELPEIMEVRQSQIHVNESGEPLTASGLPSTIRAVTS